jgi:hypothetical protein
MSAELAYAVVGVIANNGANVALAGRKTYLVSTSDWFTWDGDRPEHAAQFADRVQAIAAAEACAGPLFRMPHPDTIKVVVQASR